MRYLLINIFCVCVVVLTLSGCKASAGHRNGNDSGPSSAVNQTIPQMAKPSTVIKADNEVLMCQRKLVVLEEINPGEYNIKKQAFDTLVNGAITYKKVRDDVNFQTKEIIDSLFKYKIRKLCNEVEEIIQRGLINKGESV